jgi:hypothetical protein
MTSGDRWRSPLFMPRWAARLWLRLVDVRVERLQEISGMDALAEGVEILSGVDDRGPARLHAAARARFKELWDSLNARRGYPWSSNCHVWVLSFERAEVQP